METRMEKYNSSRLNTNRTEKNKELYKEVNKTDLEVSRVYSNSRVIAGSNNEIDIEKIKRYIEKMNDNTTVRRTKINEIATPDYEVKEETETKEYDINAILEKARSKREVDYSQERSKKVNGRYEELIKKLDEFNAKYGEKDEDDDDLNTGERKIVDLFNTIKLQEEADLFEDLKASEDTQVLGNIDAVASDESFKDEIKKQISSSGFTTNYTRPMDLTLTEEEKKTLLENTIKEEVKKESVKEEVEEDTDTDSLKVTGSFYTTNDVFNKKDFESNDEENWEEEKATPLKTIGLIIALIILLAILVAVINYVFKLGLF